MELIETNRQVVHTITAGPEVQQWLERTLEDQRHLYNAALESALHRYRVTKQSTGTGKFLNYYDLCSALTECRADIPEMAECPLSIQRATVNRLHLAFQAFFARRKKGLGKGFPRFKGRAFWHSFGFRTAPPVRDGKVKLAGRWVRLRRRGGNPYPDGKPVSAVVRRTGKRWEIVLCLKVSVPDAEDNGKTIGLDMNVGQVAVSDGTIHRLPDSSRLSARKRRYERRKARQRKGSARWRRTKARIFKCARAQANVRATWAHHVSKDVAAKAGTVAVEDLNTRGMTRSAKGDAENPGTNVAQKAGLNREILRTGWADLRQKLEYKAAKVIAVNPAYTSQKCHECGAVDAASRRSQAEFVCTSCGHTDNADLNAAKNIAAAVTAASGRGGGGTARPVKRQTRNRE